MLRGGVIRSGAPHRDSRKGIEMGLLGHHFDIVDQSTFRNGMSRLGAAVSVVTTDTADQRYGFTASAVCSVSDTPPTLLVCINRSSSCFPAFASARHFASTR